MHMYVYVVCYAPLNGQVDCGNGLVTWGFEGDNCNFSCDPGYMLQGNVTSGTCENNRYWSDELSFSGSKSDESSFSGSGSDESSFSGSGRDKPLFSGSGSEESPFYGSWSGGLPSCVPFNCSKDTLPVPPNTRAPPSCDLTYLSQCTVSCDEGFTGDDVTYLCNLTSDLTVVNWMVPNRAMINQPCERGLLLYQIYYC